MPQPDKLYEHFLIILINNTNILHQTSVESWILFPENLCCLPVLEWTGLLLVPPCLCVGVFLQFHPTICSIWLWPVSCSSLALCLCSVVSSLFVSLFWTSSASPPPSISNIFTPLSHSPWFSSSPCGTKSARQDQYLLSPGTLTTLLESSL